MGNLFASLDAAAGALRAFREGITVSQNNVNNALTPGYAKQNIRLEAQSFDLLSGAIGGVRAGAVLSSRSWFAESAVRQQLSFLGNFNQQTNGLAQIEGVFDVAGQSGVPAALNRLFNSFAEFSSSPNSLASRQSVLDAAAEVSVGFNRAAAELDRIASQIDGQIEQTVSQINLAAAQVQEYNRQVVRGDSPDPGLQAQAVADVESLAELANVEVLFEADGTMTVLLAGQIPLVIGDSSESISAETFVPAGAINPGARPSIRVVDSGGRDITGLISQGELRGLLRVRTEVLPAVSGDALQDGSLNVLAKRLADRVNDILTNAQVSAGPPPVPGVPLFAYDASNGAVAARTLALSPAISADQLAAASSGPPFVSNGAALELAGMRNSGKPEDTINGMSFLDFYASQARDVGEKLSTARQEEARSQLLMTQARDLRQQLSGVSLDEEALKLTELQRSYEANAQVVKIVDEMIQSVLSMMR